MLEQKLLRLRPETEIVGITTDIPESVSVIASNPDLDIIFADIRIDDGMSFSIFDRISSDAMVVFTTAYDEYALKAFDYNCVDYLLKPVSEESLDRALTRCERRHHASMEAVIRATNDIRNRTVSFRKYLSLKRGNEMHICKVDDICYILTDNGIVRAFLSNGLWGDIDCSLSELETSLSDKLFFRINRQAIIHVDMVAKVNRGPGRDSTVHLKSPYNETSFKMTQEKKKALMRLLNSR